MMKSSFFLVVFFLLFSCGNKKNHPSAVLLKPDSMKVVFWDIIRADAFTSQFIKKDISKNTVVENAKLQKEIFALHYITKEDFYWSYSYYKAHPNLMKTILDSMLMMAGRERNFDININTPLAK